MEHALVRGDVRMVDDPIRAQSLSLISGVILAVIIVAACAVLAFLRPPGTLGTAPIVMVRDSGALYVRVGDTVHPVLNLASARLIAGTPANPEAVSAAAINNSKRGPLVGIPGAPATISAPLGEDESGWAVCDDAASTTVIAGDVISDGLASGGSVLVTPRSESVAGCTRIPIPSVSAAMRAKARSSYALAFHKLAQTVRMASATSRSGSPISALIEV